MWSAIRRMRSSMVAASVPLSFGRVICQLHHLQYICHALLLFSPSKSPPKLGTAVIGSSWVTKWTPLTFLNSSLIRLPVKVKRHPHDSTPTSYASCGQRTEQANQREPLCAANPGTLARSCGPRPDGGLARLASLAPSIS